MRSWFPFTDYDFYAYLASGFCALLALDMAITGGDFLLRDDWNFIQIVVIVAIAYASGQVVAMPSSTILEFGFARRLLIPPIAILIGARAPRWRERFIAKWFIGRYYEPFDIVTRERILSRAEELTNSTRENLLSEPEAVFQQGFAVARQNPDTRQRLDDFRNQYGLNRNLGFVGLAAGIAIGIRGYLIGNSELMLWAIGVFVFGSLLTFRFLKFYSQFAAEVLRALACKAPSSEAKK